MGGRGASSFTNKSNNRWSNGLGTNVNETLKEAIGSKGKPASIEEAMRSVNPHYNGDFNEYSQNCQRVVVAYELRRRGYRVYAQPTYRGDNLGEIITYGNGKVSARWTGSFKNAKIDNVSATRRTKAMRNVESKMREYGNGTRAVLQIHWKNGGAHVLNVEQVNGKTKYIDAQTGETKTKRWLQNRIKPSKISLVRVDNLKISERAKKAVTTRRY